MTGFIYVMVRSGGDLKIGRSKHPKKRHNDLESKVKSHIVVVAEILCDRPVAVERAAHKCLAEYCVGGEWFQISFEQAVTAILQALQDVSSSVPKTHTKALARRAIQFTAERIGDYGKAGGIASGTNRSKIAQAACEAIRERWGMPSEQWSETALCNEAGVSRPTAIKYLGTREEAQRTADAVDASRFRWLVERCGNISRNAESSAAEIRWSDKCENECDLRSILDRAMRRAE